MSEPHGSGVTGVMRSRRKSLNQEAAELNITAFMNLMVILVPFLLITAVFSRMTVLELNLPGLDGSSGDEQEVKLQLQLVVHSDYWLVQDGNLGEIKRIEHTDNDRHWRQLKEVLVVVKARLPEETGNALLFNSNTTYNSMIQVTSNVRSTKLLRAGTIEAIELLPDISLGD